MDVLRKIVMQVTLNAEECPDLHRELVGMASARRRVKRLLSLASVGLLVEQGRLGGGLSVTFRPAAPTTSMSLKPLAEDEVSAPQELQAANGDQSIDDMNDMFVENLREADVDESA
jgi:hypothetical protein